MTTWEKAQQMANPEKHAYYMKRVHLFEKISDDALKAKKWDIAKWADNMFKYYMDIAREFDAYWIEYKLIMGWA